MQTTRTHGRWLASSLLLLPVLLALSDRRAQPVLAQQKPMLAQPMAADHAAASMYEHPFGESPFLPSNATTAWGGFLKPDDLPQASYCEHCHQQVHADWRQSAHANSFRTPWYTKNVGELATTRGIAATRHCEGCHNPAALLSGSLTTASTVSRPHDQDGVTCMVCHSIRSVSSTAGIGSYVMGQPAVMLDAAGKPVAGIPTDAEILTHLERHKAAVMQPLYKTSEYCAACHKAAVPRSLNGYKWLRSFSTYDEWQQSSWSKETPLSFYTKPAAQGCQACHMPAEATTDPAAHEHQGASHRFLGANTGVAMQYGFDEQARRLVEFLKRDQVEIDLFGLTIEHAPGSPATAFVPASLVAPLGSRAFTVLPGDWVRVDVVVRNKGIGHTLIPELRDFFESWLDFEAVDDAGKTVYRSGAVDDRHRVDPAARSYTLRILGQDGHQLDHHEVWKVYTKAYDASVSPGRSDVVRYRFQMPVASRGLTVRASLRYRRFNREFTDWVFSETADAPDRFPTVTLATASMHLAAGDNQALAGRHPAPDQTDLFRWNNYGIGMLDRLAYAEAVNAFTHVVQLDPSYEPGLVNVAIAEYSRGRYPVALGWLDRAAKLNPHDSRADYFRGLCLRWQKQYDEAIAVLAPVAAQWPRFRQVHQELGYLYVIQKRWAESKAQYDAVLAIDPDDALAHRWLGPVLAALGDPAGAKREAALATATGNDTAAGWTAQRFWREHLDTARVAMPGHTFSAGNLHDDSDVARVLNLQNPPSTIWIEHY